MHTTKCCQQDQGKYKKSPQTKHLFIYLLFHKIKFLLITVIKIFKNREMIENHFPVNFKLSPVRFFYAMIGFKASASFSFSASASARSLPSVV